MHFLRIKWLAIYFLLTIPVLNIFADSITVTGVTYTYSGSTASVTGYTSLSGIIDIPATISVGGSTYNVTSIGSFAFSGCTNLSSVTIPSSVTRIEDSAFALCMNLRSVIFNEIEAPTIYTHSFFGIKSGAKGFYPYGSNGYTASTIRGTSVSGQLTMISTAAVTSALTASGTVGSAFTYAITSAGGSGSVLAGSFIATPLPTGLSLDPTNGRISGAPTVAGNTNVTIGFQDAMSYPAASATLVITIAAAPAPVIPSKIAAGISITNTTQTYTGKPLSVTTSLSPSTLSAAVVYYPGFNVPTEAGTYYVLVNVVDNTYYGSRCTSICLISFISHPYLYRSNTLTPSSFAVTSADLPLFIHMRMACSLSALS